MVAETIVLNMPLDETSGLMWMEDQQHALNQLLEEVDLDAVRASIADTSGGIVLQFFIGVQGFPFL